MTDIVAPSPVAVLPGVSVAPPEPRRSRLTAPIKATAGAGQMVESVSTTLFGAFLFFYYTALLGLPGSPA